ncbi:DUF2325 domain-containing protein [Paenibacillus sp. NRS-1780]|uniref:DUF2325 domain-containing protein n=2 Tax=unclassified Paenibacillus TaxID=185978 RepID=UPI003D2E35BF
MSKFFDDFVHLKVYLVGRCTKCKHYNELMVHDYGRLPYSKLEDEMDRTNHPIRPISCNKCGTEYKPQQLVYRDVVRDSEVAKVNIDYSNIIDDEKSAAMQEGHDDRFKIYQKREQEFWAAYTEFALEDWKSAVGELMRQEIEAGFAALGKKTTLKSDLHARREVLQKIAASDRRSFWIAANQEFIVGELLDLGVMGWVPIEFAKRYGAARTRFGVMYFPIAEALEDLRTKYIGLLFKRERGDNAFLLRRIGQLTDAAHKQTVKYNKALRQTDEQKHVIAEMQDKLGVANARITELSRQQPAQSRDSDDIRRIRELKSFVGELLAELRAIRPDEPEDIGESPMLDESGTDGADTSNPDLSALEGKTVAIIGGYRSRRDNGDYPCEITTHDGRKHDPDFYAALQQADIIVVLTRFISHASMWEARTVAAQEDKPIHYAQEINIGSILNIVAQK